jgi:hypothetical protein
MLHTFTATGYEIAEMNYDNLTKMNFIKIKNNDPMDLINHVRNYQYSFNNTKQDTVLKF